MYRGNKHPILLVCTVSHFIERLEYLLFSLTSSTTRVASRFKPMSSMSLLPFSRSADEVVESSDTVPCKVVSDRHL